MASDGVPVSPPVTRIQPASKAPQPATIQKVTGKPLPTSGQILPTRAEAQPKEQAASKPTELVPTANSAADLRALLARLNKHLNDTGQPNQFRVDTTSGSNVIQEINPASGEVVGEYSATEFPALARGLGFSGLVIDSHA
jgi:hypothetical protein